jgi:hypothetical protein
VSLDSSGGVNGNVLHLTVTRRRRGSMGFETFLLYSTLGQSGNLWVGAIGD